MLLVTSMYTNMSIVCYIIRMKETAKYGPVYSVWIFIGIQAFIILGAHGPLKGHCSINLVASQSKLPHDNLINVIHKFFSNQYIIYY